MKFKYNPTLDRLLLAANYAQAGKTKKLGKILDEIAFDENVEKDVEALNALQIASTTPVAPKRKKLQRKLLTLKDRRQKRKIKARKENVSSESTDEASTEETSQVQRRRPRRRQPQSDVKARLKQLR